MLVVFWGCAAKDDTLDGFRVVPFTGGVAQASTREIVDWTSLTKERFGSECAAGATAKRPGSCEFAIRSRGGMQRTDFRALVECGVDVRGGSAKLKKKRALLETWELSAS